MECREIRFSGHATRRMFARGLATDNVITVVRDGRRIIEYPDDSPYPSVLLLGFVRDRPLHVVVAVDSALGVCYVVTAYEPDPELWEPDFTTRRPS